MQTLYQYIKEHWIGWFMGLIIIMMLATGVYFGYKLWLQYANTVAFQGPVNAAIITGFIGLITLVGTISVTSYFNFRAHRLTIRDEIFKKRLEIYSEIYVQLPDLLNLGLRTVNNPTEENRKRLEHVANAFFTFIMENQFVVSPQVYKKAFSFARTMQFISRLDLYDYYLKQFSPVKDIDKKIIVTPDMIITDIRENDYWPLMELLQKEFGLKFIEKDMRKLR
ncbi:hypothetical protein U2I54_16665 [Bacillus pseudomycoides]|uniref:DUF4760 domain-containing protein n=1 Tax=Bacillus bingmayongensis TaxID=1150157 RepID=A0ABU5JYX5_9BACI|nr:hypothetical protein [Bacillus pseudomycoides]